MQRYDSNLNKDINGKYILHQDHIDEVEKLKQEIEKLKKEYKIATTTEAYKHYFNERDRNYQGSDW